jgi:hypothetical protein
LNARNFFQTRVPFRVYNQFGGSFGGPVVLPGYDGRNRTFFFGAFEGNRDHKQTNFNSSVPSLAVRQGDFSQVRNNAGNLIVIRDPTNNNQPFAGNIIPSTRLSPVSLRAQERFYLPPNFGGSDGLNQNLRETVSNAPYWNHFDIRADHRFNDKNAMYARYTWRNMPTPGTRDTRPDQHAGHPRPTCVQHHGIFFDHADRLQQRAAQPVLRFHRKPDHREAKAFHQAGL